MLGIRKISLNILGNGVFALTFFAPLLSPALGASITIDGNKNDWASIPQLISDPAGDISNSHEDIISVSVTNDISNIYFLLEFVGNPQFGDTSIALDTDMNINTGCTLFGPASGGHEYWATFSFFIGQDFLGDARDCGVDLNDPNDFFPGALLAARGGTFIEASVPITTLEILTGSLVGFDISTLNDSTTLTRYTIKNGLVPIPEPSTLLFFGSGIAGLVLWRYRKGKTA